MTMTTITDLAPTGVRKGPHGAIRQRAAAILRKVGKRLIELYSEPPLAGGEEVSPDAWRFPPF